MDTRTNFAAGPMSLLGAPPSPGVARLQAELGEVVARLDDMDTGAVVQALLESAVPDPDARDELARIAAEAGTSAAPVVVSWIAGALVGRAPATSEGHGRYHRWRRAGNLFVDRLLHDAADGLEVWYRLAFCLPEGPLAP